MARVLLCVTLALAAANARAQNGDVFEPVLPSEEPSSPAAEDGARRIEEPSAEPPPGVVEDEPATRKKLSGEPREPAPREKRPDDPMTAGIAAGATTFGATLAMTIGVGLCMGLLTPLNVIPACGPAIIVAAALALNAFDWIGNPIVASYAGTVAAALAGKRRVPVIPAIAAGAIPYFLARGIGLVVMLVSTVVAYPLAMVAMYAGVFGLTCLCLSWGSSWSSQYAFYSTSALAFAGVAAVAAVVIGGAGFGLNACCAGSGCTLGSVLVGVVSGRLGRALAPGEQAFSLDDITGTSEPPAVEDEDEESLDEAEEEEEPAPPPKKKKKRAPRVADD